MYKSSWQRLLVIVQFSSEFRVVLLVVWWDISQTCSDCWWGMWKCILMTNWHIKHFLPQQNILVSIIFRLEKNCCCCCHTQIIFDSLFGKDLNGKLRVYAVQFVHHICLWSSDKVINMMGPVLLSGMTKLINEDKQVCIHCLMMLLEK